MIIVTGGAGFIGSALVAELNRRGKDHILIVDILGSDERWKNLRKLRYSDYVEADDFFEMLAQGEIDFSVEAVFHLGACSDTTETNCSYLVKNNYDCSKMLANWAVNNEIRFIYASSAATYGSGDNGFADNEKKLNDLIPLNMYGYSKHMFDLWARNAGLLSSIAGLKYFNVFGPNEYHKGEMRSFVHKAYHQIRETSKVRLFESHHTDYEHGGQMRDFLYIHDAVDMTLHFFENPSLAGIYNIGTGHARTWLDLATAVFEAMGKDPDIEFIAMPEHLRGKYQYFTQADIAKLQKSGYDKDTISLEEAISEYVRKYLNKNEYLGSEKRKKK